MRIIASQEQTNPVRVVRITQHEHARRIAAVLFSLPGRTTYSRVIHSKGNHWLVKVPFIHSDYAMAAAAYLRQWLKQRPLEE